MDQSRHLIFTGNPGTGKTTVARLLAQIYRTLGVVERGHLVETDRAGLVAGYVGQTAPLVLARFDEADQGVLLIDEAYSLVRGGERDFGREAIDAIVKLIEDRRDRIVVVMAGYPDEMEELISSNPGLRSRFPKVIHFPDYTTDELLAIIDSMADKGGYRLDPGARARARIWLDSITRDKGFGNGRTARNLFEHAVSTQATRLAPDRLPHRRAAHRPRRRRHPRPGRGAAHDRATGRYGLTVRRVLAVLAAVGMVVAAVMLRAGHGRRRRRRSGDGDDGAAVVVCATDLADACDALGSSVEVRTEDPAVTAAALADGHASPTTSTPGSPPRRGWRSPRAARPDALGDARAIATSPATVATAPGRHEAITDLCAGDDIWQCLGGVARAPTGPTWATARTRSGAS